MTDLLSMLAYFLAATEKYIAYLAGGLNVLNGVLTFLLKLREVWEKFQPKGSKMGKNKRSTKRNHCKNP